MSGTRMSEGEKARRHHPDPKPLAITCGLLLAVLLSSGAPGIEPSPSARVAAEERSSVGRVALVLESELALWRGQDPVEARLFSSGRPPLALAFFDDGGKPWLIDPVGARVWLSEESEVSHDGLSATTSWPPLRAPIGTLVSGANKSRLVTLAGILEFAPRRELIGPYMGWELVIERPAYGARLKAYSPGRSAIEELRTTLGRSVSEVEIRVLFGSWCVSCQHFVPHALRVEEELAETGASFRYYAIPAEASDEQRAETERMGVTSVPTAVVFAGGEEVGRLEGPDGFRSFERRLSKLLSPGSAP